MLDYLFKILNKNFIISYLKIYFNNDYKELFIILYIELFIFLAMFLKLLIFFMKYGFINHYNCYFKYIILYIKLNFILFIIYYIYKIINQINYYV
jgi:hypothetical protein